MIPLLSSHRSLPRGLAAGILLLSLLLWGCSGDELTGVTGSGLLPKKSPSPASTDVGGAVQKADPTASPTATPTPTPSPSPTQNLVTEPLPTPFAMGITVSLAHATINLAPVGGASPLYRYTTTVTGTVKLSNALDSHDIEWSSSNEAIATVARDGTVTAGSTTGGLVRITGTSQDGLVSAAADLTVTAFGGAEVVVD